MNDVYFLITILCICILLLSITLCVDVMEYLKYIFYKGKGKATIIEVEFFSIQKSRSIVEKQLKNGEYVAIPTTQDKSVYYFTFFQDIFLRKKTFPILVWSVGNENWRAHYRHLRKKGGWKVGDTVEIHYSLEKPWKYALYDKKLWIMAFVKCVLYIIIIGIGIYLLSNII